MANEQNLKSIGDRTTKEQREITSKGGKKSGQVRAEKKKFKELFNDFLSRPVEKEEIKQKLKEFGFSDSELTNKNAMMLAQYNKALTGDTSAFTAVRDTLGEKPTDKLEIGQDEPFKVNITVKR